MRHPRSADMQLEASARLKHRHVASILSNADMNKLAITYYKTAHKMPVNCVRISDDEKYVYSAGKDCTVTKWDISTGKKVAEYLGHRGKPEVGGHTHEILAMALSTDGKLLATGSRDKLIKIWDTEKNVCVDTFKGHRDAVSALTFRVGSRDLYSASFDREVKIWDCKEMSYIDTLQVSPLSSQH